MENPKKNSSEPVRTKMHIVENKGFHFLDFVQIRPYLSDLGKIEKNDFSNFFFFFAFSGNSFILDFYKIGRFVVHRGPSKHITTLECCGLWLSQILFRSFWKHVDHAGTSGIVKGGCLNWQGTWQPIKYHPRRCFYQTNSPHVFSGNVNTCMTRNQCLKQMFRSCNSLFDRTDSGQTS